MVAPAPGKGEFFSWEGVWKAACDRLVQVQVVAGAFWSFPQLVKWLAKGKKLQESNPVAAHPADQRMDRNAEHFEHSHHASTLILRAWPALTGTGGHRPAIPPHKIAPEVFSLATPELGNPAPLRKP